MQIILNEETVPGSFADNSTLGDLLKELRERDLVSQEELIVDLEADGTDWMGLAAEDPLDAELKDISELNLRTGNDSEYVGRVLDDADSMLEVLTEACREVSRSFAQDSPRTANHHLFLLLDSVQQLIQCLLAAQATAIGNDREIQEWDEIRQLGDALSRVQRFQSDDRWHELAMSLRNDMLPTLQRLSEVTARMRKQL